MSSKLRLKDNTIIVLLNPYEKHLKKTVYKKMQKI